MTASAVRAVQITAPAVSVIVVSRGRPEDLPLCLTAVGQMYHALFEIVVVADPAGIAAVTAMGWADRVKMVPFDTPNIAMARNRGIAAAAGQIVAFIDDDAVPEPTWLTHLVAPIATGQAVAAGGFVRGRNGISWQWQGRDVRPDASSAPINVQNTQVFQGTAERGIKTEGTNMAFDRATLVGIGGFDPAFAYYLDETDVNMRLAQAGMVTALVPLAQVHHGYRASVTRRADRVPRDLRPIGRSLAVYLRKHFPGGDPLAMLQAEVATQRARLLRHMVAGRIEPRDVSRRLAELRNGWAEGQAMSLPMGPTFAGPPPPFLPFARPPVAGHRVLAGRRLAPLAQDARALVAQGHVVSVYVFSATALYHHIRFAQDGFWVQRGGLFGRSDRRDPVFTWWRRVARVRRERTRVAACREVPDGPTTEV